MARGREADTEQTGGLLGQIEVGIRSGTSRNRTRTTPQTAQVIAMRAVEPCLQHFVLDLAPKITFVDEQSSELYVEGFAQGLARYFDCGAPGFGAVCVILLIHDPSAPTRLLHGFRQRVEIEVSLAQRYLVQLGRRRPLFASVIAQVQS